MEQIYTYENLAVVDDAEKGSKVITTSRIKKGEIICAVFFESIRPYEMARSNAIQRAEDAFLDSSKETLDDFINHSCDANAFVNFSKYTFDAIRDIDQWEEITYNYLTTEYDLVRDGLEFECKCGSQNCHGEIKGFKYLSKEEQMKLWPYLTAYLRLDIDAV